MQLRQVLCDRCGVRIEVGRATCPVCGGRAGTVFSETASLSAIQKASAQRQAGNPHSIQDIIEKARDSANHSVILSLLGLFPVIGFILAPFSIYLALRATRTLKSYEVEDGRGVAAAGIIIGALALLAQISYLVLVMGSGQSLLNLF
jgi:uncharacterized Zn finger protein (UPF0148 family)